MDRGGFNRYVSPTSPSYKKAGLPPRVVALAQHTDYRLTYSTYTDMQLIDTFGAVGRPPTCDEPKAQVAVRTGTDDRPIGVDQIRHQKRRSNPHAPAISCSIADNDGGESSSSNAGERGRKPRKTRGFGQRRGTEKAGMTGLETGLPGLEPGTF